jgi:CheY-like chemotaxis protein
MLESERCYEIVAVPDGMAAWQELENGIGFNLCIVDIMMPKLDGLQLTARMRADPRFKSQRVILCTALNDRETIEQASILGVSHYIVKPYAKEHVLRQVRRVCEETPASIYFEPQTQVLARLGVGGAQLRLFQFDLHRDVRDFSAALASGAKPDAVQTNALKGAAMNLGARAGAAFGQDRDLAQRVFPGDSLVFGGVGSGGSALGQFAWPRA